MRPLIFSLIIGFFVFAPALALADEPIVGEIRLLASSSPPDGWLICDGRSLNTDEYYDLWSTIGYGYGGAWSEFYLPDLTGRVPVGLSSTQIEFDELGETGGEISHTLTTSEMPSHRHSYINQTGESGYVYSRDTTNGTHNPLTTGTYFSPSYYTSYTGSGQPHNNLQPYVTLNYIIFTGVYQNPPTPTATITPTATLTNAIYLPYTSAYTYTLPSSRTLTIPVYVTFGQVLISSTTLAVLAVVIFGVVTRLVRR